MGGVDTTAIERVLRRREGLRQRLEAAVSDPVFARLAVSVSDVERVRRSRFVDVVMFLVERHKDG